MPRARSIAVGEYYHLFNRGAHKTDLFRDEKDWLRFLFLLIHCQAPTAVQNIGRFLRPSALLEGFKVPPHYVEEIANDKFVELVSFCIMPNHFHVIVRELQEGGIAQYMQRVTVGYTMHFNARHGSSGHLFQGRYKNVHIKDNDQLLYLSAYIHRNPRELVKWKGYELAYPYSSFQDLVEENRWGRLLAGDIILSQFDDTAKSNYLGFVNSSTAKMMEGEMPEESFASVTK